MAGKTPQDKPDRHSPERISQMAEKLFGQKVLRITAPGGKDRDSLRVVLESRSVIASHRRKTRQLKMETEVLDSLNGAGAPVPALLGTVEDVLFQEDLGSGRLSSAMARADAAGRQDLARKAFGALWEIKLAARNSGLNDRLAPLNVSATWVSRFSGRPRGLSGDLGIVPPDLDWATLARQVTAVPRHFVKWDARSGNASVQPDGRVLWFDWEYAGLRHGVEDFAFLIADEFWLLEPEASLAAFEATCPGPPDRLMPYLQCFATLQIVERLRLVSKEQAKGGWTSLERAQRYDRIGAVPELAARLCVHGSALAAMAGLTRPMSDWFLRVRDVLAARSQARAPQSRETNFP